MERQFRTHSDRNAGVASTPGCFDAREVDALVRENELGLRAWARARTRSDAETEDLLAEIFAAAFRRRSIYDPARGSTSQWLWGIARIELLRWRRARASEARLLGRLQAEIEPSLHRSVSLALEELEPDVRGEEVAAACAALRTEDQLVLWLRFGERATSAEIGQRLGCSPGAARVRMSRALAILRGRLGVVDATSGGKARRR